MARALLVLALVLAPSLAHAQESQGRRAANAALYRARRSVAIGPVIGVGGSYAVSAGEAEVPLSLGLELVMLDIPVVPDAELIKDAVIARDVGVVDEFLGDKPRRDRTLEKPKLVVSLEGTYLPRAGSGQIRLGAGVGLWKVTIGPTAAVDFAGDTGIFVGGELAVHLTPGDGVRPRVYDVLVRYDYGATSGTDGADTITIGARLLVDLL
jgi:hypothetical protein